MVTGASRGIGHQKSPRHWQQREQAVIVNYNGSAKKAEEVVKEIEARGGRAEALQCNVSDYDRQLTDDGRIVERPTAVWIFW